MSGIYRPSVIFDQRSNWDIRKISSQLAELDRRNGTESITIPLSITQRDEIFWEHRKQHRKKKFTKKGNK